MTVEQFLIAHLVKALMFFALVGIVCNRRAHFCWSFVCYLTVGLASNALVSFWPEHFYQRWFWILTHGISDALKMGIAMELGYRTFQAFPGAQAAFRRLLFGLLIATAGFLIGIPMSADYGVVLLEWQPRVLTGTIWLMSGLALLITWYRVPVHAYHKSILLGFVPYMMVFTTLLTLVGQHPGLMKLLQAAEPSAYLLVMGFWTWAAWRPEAQPDVSPALMRFLHPWRTNTGSPLSFLRILGPRKA